MQHIIDDVLSTLAATNEKAELFWIGASVLAVVRQDLVNGVLLDVAVSDKKWKSGCCNRVPLRFNKTLGKICVQADKGSHVLFQLPEGWKWQAVFAAEQDKICYNKQLENFRLLHSKPLMVMQTCGIL